MKEKSLETINHYGVLPQLKYFQSEVFELNEAIITYEKSEEESCHSSVSVSRLAQERKHIAEEIADVEVMLLQFKEYYKIDGNDILKTMKYKIERQKMRMGNEDTK
jgi:NTP pyrophosphatase (non-canonical NTP hydrolase)